jgi:hypothetical protein
MIRNFHLTLSIVAMLSACTSVTQRKPIALHPRNPHYFIYDNKPEVLITSGEHYGALLNLDFDYVTYLDALAKDSLNLTRVFTGAYLEPQGAFNIERNTLAPKPERFICPWQRTDTPGHFDGGNKFDLTRWNQEYFDRLKDFMLEAEKRGVIVELTLFCPFYEDIQWNLSPMNSTNNVNGVGPKDRMQVYTLDKSDGLLEIQEALVKKLVSELQAYGNLIYEICNEPYFGGVTMEWQHRIASLITDEEQDFEYKHLISQNIANDRLLIQNPHPNVSIFNFHYAYPPVTVSQNYHLNKVIGDNETGFDGNSDSTYRREGWSFILNGGALYNNLDYSFTADNEQGDFEYPSSQPGGGTAALRSQLSYLKSFIGGFDFLSMRPDSTLVTTAGLQEDRPYALVEPGKQYAIYMFGKGPHSFSISAAAGNYTVEYMNPLTGIFESSQEVVSDGTLKLTSPEFTEDVAIKILSAGRPL